MNKPNIFKPEIGKINNNKKMYCSYLENKLDIEKTEERKDPNDYINVLLQSGEYLFSKNVIIETKEKIYQTKIAGKIGDKIITMDNESINIKDIIKISEKK